MQSMSEFISVNDNIDANQIVINEIASWGDLHAVDRYDASNGDKYQKLLAVAREHVGQSLVAAALVSAWDGNVIYSQFDYGPNIASAVETASEVKDIQAFHQQNPTNEVGLFLGEYHIILFKTDRMRLSTAYRAELNNNAFISIDAPLQTGLSLHSGKMSDRADVSYHSNDGHSGNYQLFTVCFNELQTKVVPRIGRTLAKPLVFGRDNVTDYYERQAVTESMQGGTTHRLASLTYGIWRVRTEDDELAGAIDTVTERYGLKELWTDQFRQEIGAKAAHVLLGAMLHKAKKDIPFEELMHTRVSGWDPEEPEIYGASVELYMPSAASNARRLGIAADDDQIEQAIDFVFRRD